MSVTEVAFYVGTYGLVLLIGFALGAAWMWRIANRAIDDAERELDGEAGSGE